MSLKPETIAQLQTLIQADPALLAQLQSSTHAASAATAITKAAAAKGIEVSAEELAAHFKQVLKVPIGMADEELDKISAGGVGAAVAVSIFSLGLACAGVSLVNALSTQKNFSCAEVLRSI